MLKVGQLQGTICNSIPNSPGSECMSIPHWLIPNKYQQFILWLQIDYHIFVFSYLFIFLQFQCPCWICDPAFKPSLTHQETQLAKWWWAKMPPVASVEPLFFSVASTSISVHQSHHIPQKKNMENHGVLRYRPLLRSPEIYVLMLKSIEYGGSKPLSCWWGPCAQWPYSIICNSANEQSSVQNPSLIPLYWLVDRGSPIGLLQSSIMLDAD